MIIPYRVQQTLKRLAIVLLVAVVALAIVAACWFLWLDRYIVYVRGEGAVLDFNLSEEFAPGQMAGEAVPDESVDIYFNEGDNAITTGTELTQMIGYYVDTAALGNMDAVREQINKLPAGTPVLVDVKNGRGSFYYSSNVNSQRASDVDITVMDELIALLQSKNMYTIARLPALRDWYYGLHHVPDGIPMPGGYLWVDDSGCYWLNPTKEGTITHLVQIVTELKNLGFDEVVFSEFTFPDSSAYVFKGDKAQAIATAAKTLVTTCSDDRFAVSFISSDPKFPLPEGRSRLYMVNAPAASADNLAQQTGLADPAVNLVFLTEVHDTRFDIYSVLRPLAAAH